MIFSKFGRLFYRLSNSGLPIIGMLFSSFHLSTDEYSKFVVLSGFSIIVTALIDFIPYKYLISKYASLKDNEDIWLVVINSLKTKIIVFFVLSIFPVVFIFHYYEVSLTTSTLVFIYAGLTAVNISLSTYYFVEKRYSFALILPACFFSILFLIYLLMVEYIELIDAILLLALYRFTELLVYIYFFMKFHSNRKTKNSIFHGDQFYKINKKWIFPAKYFYFQNLVSMSSGQIFSLITPIYLTSEAIAKYGNVLILLSAALFLGVFLSSSYYADFLARKKITNKIDFLKCFFCYYKSVAIIIISSGFASSVFGVYFFKISIIEFIYVIIYAFTIPFTAIQSFLLFKFKLEIYVFNISIVTFLINILMLLLLINFIGVYALYISSLVVQLFSIAACYSVILKSFNEKNSIFHKTSK